MKELIVLVEKRTLDDRINALEDLLEHTDDPDERNRIIHRMGRLDYLKRHPWQSAASRFRKTADEPEDDDDDDE